MPPRRVWSKLKPYTMAQIEAILRADPKATSAFACSVRESARIQTHLEELQPLSAKRRRPYSAKEIEKILRQQSEQSKKETP